MATVANGRPAPGPASRSRGGRDGSRGRDGRAAMGDDGKKMRREIPTPPPCSRLHAHRPSHGNYPISPLAQPLTRPQNDDGPPSPTESPYVLGLYQLLSQLLGLLSVLPSPASHSSIRLEYQGRPSQHPEILDRYRTSDLAEFTSLNHSLGKAYHIKETIRGVYYYPTNQGKGETSAISRPLKDGELVCSLNFDLWHLPLTPCPYRQNGSS